MRLSLPRLKMPRLPGFGILVWLFAALYLVICYLSVACWAYAGTFLRRYLSHPRGVRLFNRSMAALLVASVGYLLMA